MSTQKKISELTAKTTSVASNDIFVVSELIEGNYTSKKITGSQITLSKSYIGFLSQSSTNAPTVSYSYSQLNGAITYARTGVGTYTVTSVNGEFETNKTFVFHTYSNALALGFRYTVDDSYTITLYTYTAAGVLTDGLLTNSSFEIKIIL